MTIFTYELELSLQPLVAELVASVRNRDKIRTHHFSPTSLDDVS